MTTRRVVPIHPAVGKVGAGLMRRAIHNALKRSHPMPDPVPQEVVTRHRLIERDRAFEMIHFPDEVADTFPARRRLVFDELFRLELALAVHKRRRTLQERGVEHHTGGPVVRRFTSGLPYALTGAQRRVLEEIYADLRSSSPMHRLLQGEVGSGKTVVAVATLLTGVDGGWQGAVMAPTEVLAVQHFLGIRALLVEAGLAPQEEGEGAALGMPNLFGGAGPSVRMALLTGSQVAANFLPGADRSTVLERIADGTVDLVVGTHALIQEGVHFSRLGVAVVDEQHRFGALQRLELKAKATDIDPDLLIMTATPIPRTLSMTLYGDLDMSSIDEMPPGRAPVVTMAVSRDREEDAWDVVRREVAAGRQAFVVCPLVEDSDKVEVASATGEMERLEGIFPELRLGLLHGQLAARDKEAVMASFRAGEIDVLVATTVIEVGIDVPNATVIVIEDADRFGLSQLHQLRGRVGRGDHPGTCVLLADPTTFDGEQRVVAMVETTDGFRLAEVDLVIRGQGAVFGRKRPVRSPGAEAEPSDLEIRQSGRSDLRLADILRDVKILTAARQEAFDLVDRDPDLSAHPELAGEIANMMGDEAEWLFVS
jgi:ATP-dependent DNA helicase RecG